MNLDIEVICNYNDFYKLYDHSWSGAIDTLEDIIKYNKINEFCELINEIVEDNIDEVALNDFIWFERNYIYEQIGININE